MDGKKSILFECNVELKKGTDKNGNAYEFYTLGIDIPFGSNSISISLRASDFTSNQLLQAFLDSKYKNGGKT